MANKTSSSMPTTGGRFTSLTLSSSIKNYNDAERWQRLQGEWFASGESYRKIHQIDGKPNPLLQRRLEHPAALLPEPPASTGLR